jgi:PAS domain S-box-containing protein
MAQSSTQFSQPRFARSSNPGDTWGDSNDFDVDLLTEYLLDDGNLAAAGVTFDFAMEQPNNGSMVSPENSEDGALPPMGEPGSAQQQQQPFAQQLMPNNANMQGTMMQQFSMLPNQMFDGVQPQNNQLMFSNQMMAAAAAANNQAQMAKRRRVDPTPMQPPTATPMLAVAGGAPLMMNSQQLAAAAAQAMQQQQAVVGRGGRRKSQAQIDRRRERNRILARRTRLRKKFFFESLQKEVMDLQRENSMLKDVVKSNIDGEEKDKILEDCDAVSNLPSAVLEACGENVDAQDFSLVRSIQTSQHSFVITDPSLQDNPIVFASDDFLKLTGYSREQVLGRNCRFLQGSDTSQEKVNAMRKSLAEGEDVSVTLLNYTADGEPFWNKLFVAALRDAQNNIVNFIGVIVKVAAPEPGDPEHEKAIASLKNDFDGSDHGEDDDDYDYDSGKEDAEDTVKAIEGVVDAAVAAVGHT